VQAIGETPRRTASDVVTMALGFAAVAGATIFVFWQLRPDLLFGSHTDVGGDNAGHIAAPYYLIHNLLPHGRVTGWDPQWFGGFPLYVFYFPLPALFIAVLNVVFPYNVAFNLVTVLGSVTLPIAAWAFGRLADFRRPIPVLMAGAMLPYLFNTSYTIDGGNLTSTLAGEFSFSLSVTFGLLFLGVFARSLRTGRLRWLAAGLYAVTLLCHVVPAMAVAAVAVLLTISRWDRNAWRVLVPVGAVGALLAGFWFVPFAAALQYTTSMNYTRVTGIYATFLPHGGWWMVVPAALGTVIALVRRDRTPIVLAIGALATIACFQWLPAGFIYNERWVPFWFLFLALLAAYGVGELFRLLGAWVDLRAVAAPTAIVVGSLASVVGAVVAGGLTGFPGYTPSGPQTQVGGWVAWNYTGFEGKTGWPVYHNVVKMLDAAGRRYGCGRMQFEYITETNSPFGSTDATMALPYWTHGCVDTIDGIYFESSTSSPYHFLDQAQYSLPAESSNPIAGLNYPSWDVAAGIRHLRKAGVRYFLAISPQVIAAADRDPLLRKIASTSTLGNFPTIINQPVTNARYTLYLIRNVRLVEPLHYLPVVEASSSAKQWLDATLLWWEDGRYWPVELTRAGPASWPRAATGTLVPPRRAIPIRPTTVRNVRMGTSTISFDVGRLGAPVLVKIPYFPNWQASGATGPYEASPNFMAVVPTSHHVTLTYGTTTADQVGKLASLTGVVALGALIALRPPRMRTIPERPGPKPLSGSDGEEQELPSPVLEYGPPFPPEPPLYGPPLPPPLPPPGPEASNEPAVAVARDDEVPRSTPEPGPDPEPEPGPGPEPEREDGSPGAGGLPG